jgi:diguanylate cyclase (GGDEF)-like protein
MPRPPATDPLFAAIHAVRETPLEPGEAGMRALLQQVQEQCLPWHSAYAQAVLAARLRNVAIDEAAQLAETSLAGFEALRCPWGRCTALSVLGVLRAQAGRPRAALDLHEASAALARETGNTGILARCLLNLSASLHLLGQYDVALPIIEECYSLCGDVGPILRAHAGNNLAAVLVELAGRARSAGAPRSQWEAMATRALELIRVHMPGEWPDAEELGDEATEWTNLAAALVLLDRHGEGRRILSVLLPYFIATDDRAGQLSVQLYLGWSHLHCGEWQQALACAQAHHALVASTGRAADEHRGLEIEALALEQAGRWPEALAAFKRFHASHARHVLERATDRARALAVTMQTDRALRESQLDALTELANRRAFDAAVARAVAQPARSPRALVLIDLDHFKQINDRHGHAVGDETLRVLAAAMKRSCRSSDLPARLGGDEFAVLVGADSATALQLAQRLRGELRQWRPAPAGMASPTLSIGVAALVPGMAAADWVAAADAALYAAKAAGRDTVHVRPAEAAAAAAAGSASVAAPPLQTAG